MGITVTTIGRQEPIFEFREINDNSALSYDGRRLFIKSNQDVWMFPKCSRMIDLGLKIWIPKGHVGLIIRSSFLDYLSQYLQLDTKIIYDNDDCGTWVYVIVINRGWRPIKIKTGNILADLLIVPKAECHILNIEGQS